MREQHLTIVREVVDVEITKQSGRGGFGEMNAALNADPPCRTILVEKTDRLYRNIKDWMTVDDLDVTTHFVKENAVVSRTSHSSDKFLHGIKVLMAKNYVDNLATHRIEADPTRGPLIAKLFEWYATGAYSLRAVTAKAHSAGLTHPR